MNTWSQFGKNTIRFLIKFPTISTNRKLFRKSKTSWTVTLILCIRKWKKDIFETRKIKQKRIYQMVKKALHQNQISVNNHQNKAMKFHQGKNIKSSVWIGKSDTRLKEMYSSMISWTLSIIKWAWKNHPSKIKYCILQKTFKILIHHQKTTTHKIRK